MLGLYFAAVVTLSAASSAAAPATELDAQRKAFVKAEAMIKSRRYTQLSQLRPSLNDYPLAIYLDYQLFDSRLSVVSGDRAAQFIAEVDGTPLALRFKDRYLRSQGKLRRWDNVLTASPERPKDITLQCYFFRAHNQKGDRALAWAGASELWLHGKSRPKACDPLFDSWLKADQMTNALSWQRQRLAFDAHRSGLMTYAAGKASPALDVWAQHLLSVYKRPDRVDRLSLPVDEERSRHVYVHAVKRLARRDAALALKIWQRAAERYPFTDTEAQEAQDEIAWRALFQHLPDTQPWLDDYLLQRRDSKRLEKRLRLAIVDSDWASLQRLLEGLPDTARSASVWTFWEAYAAREQGDLERASTLWSALADEREYYGFLAAELLGQPYQLNHRPVPSLETQHMPESEAALTRIEELMHFDREREAQSEWGYLLRSVTSEQQVALGRLAVDRNWHRFAIDAATAAQAWDALELRFPRAFETTFVEIGQQYAIPETELMAIARRESAFFPGAVSGAGARGLMQLMPSTARRLEPSLRGKNVSQRLLDINTNVELGGAYYRKLLDDHDNNRLLTLAAYNAGPHRVRRWMSNKGEGLTAPQWVESIPFKETRDYVQAVLAYNVVYRQMNQAPVRLFNDSELARRY
ncbi:MAG: transglycosylase SLT domain-containing protein [Pseudomonadota bacterium]